MKPGARTRKAGLFAALALTLVAVRWVDGEADLNSAGAATRREPAAEQPRNVDSAPRRATPAAELAVADDAGIDLSRLRRSPVAKPEDAFGVRTWDPPPRKISPREAKAQRDAAAAMPPPPPPPPPPLPYTYLGMLDSGEGRTVFLEQQDRSLSAQQGDVLDGAWRLDEATDSRLVFTYLPLDRQQSLVIGKP